MKKTLTTIAIMLAILFATALILVVSLSNKVEKVDIGEYYQPSPKPAEIPPSEGDEAEEVALEPAELTDSINIFIIGTDSRADEEGVLAANATPGMRSDTNILLHIPQDKNLPVEVISIPRDSWVQIPSCILPSGVETKPRETKFNAAFAYGGQTGDIASAIGCTLTTFSNLTGIDVDEAVVVDFSGFKNIIDSVGGVEIEVDEEIYSKNANGLRLSPGTHLLDGETALQYARARTGQGLGDRGDLGRIERQQEVIASLVNKVRGDLLNPVKTYGAINETVEHLTLTNNFNNMELLSIANSLGDREITIETIPYKDRGDRANVLWTEETEQLWERVRSQ